ncbi:GAF domain-containing protein [Nocardioides alpinus]|uniref:Antitermination regulator n=1 Tax=Nocardioides alpinus TaxID=748909 RepID=A0A1I0ZES8_9ACTN|nr:GAF and ANTAR domain-containing protein [Nocardioides alpinus]PKH40646.1 antitermination regulator [Nocardioides alpinus]SFB23892.1 GAF domain-containing protein [Nocardioides alpinus]
MSGVVHRMGVFKELAQALGETPDEEQKVTLAVHAATSLVELCCHAGFTVNDQGGLSTRASSDDVVRRANELQQELGEGPCLDVMRELDTVVAPDLAADRRWPVWAPRVHDDLKVGSMISVLVYTGTQSYGALSMYAHRGGRFDADDVAIAQTLAVQLAAVLTTSREIDQLGMALHSRTIIGQATGLVMGRFGVDASQAFDYLRRVSSHSNQKLVEVARTVVSTGDLPDLV